MESSKMVEIRIRREQIREQAFRRQLRKASQQERDIAVAAVRRAS